MYSTLGVMLNFDAAQQNTVRYDSAAALQEAAFRVSHRQGGVRYFDAGVKILTPRHLCENSDF